ncbi:hypothetical protein BCR36DRAFT_415760 [Piromyces finnis]|uniref:S phase cyclin A-associated protein in the endoplasmic reticulum N-terminal domain-containing protein n=1 Tax=Piromyces finnis TaxID=1754191 RepID=A0A1Y1V044_9FUNG|nr:hypothetical protein BCR36DRAFT_415760 [Piromyces finnis]|eukprot:ORX43137.1 hypothetical protein BCR36DRAFT_415760 [Piromyces finnis]
MNELQKTNNERRKLLYEIRAQKVKTQHEKKWKIKRRKEVEKKINNLLYKRLMSEQETKRINKFKNNLMVEEEELRKEINNKVEMASKRHAEQIELVKEKAAAVIKHSKGIKKNQCLNINESNQEFENSVIFNLPIIKVNKNIRKQNKLYKKEFMKICQALNIEVNNNPTKDIDESITLKIEKIKNNFDYYDINECPKDMLKQLNSDINNLINYSDKYISTIIKSKILISVLKVCLKTEETKWLFPSKFICRSLLLIENSLTNKNMIQSIIYFENPMLFNIINIQSRILILLETSKESDHELSTVIDLIKISTSFFKIILALLEYSYDENKELYNIILKHSYEKPIYEEYKPKDNEISYLSIFNSEIINEFIILMDSLLLYKGYTHSVSTKLSNKMLEISLNVLKTLNNISTLNNESVKNLLNTEIMQNQLFHFISFWLDYWSMWVYPNFIEEEGIQLIDNNKKEEEKEINDSIDKNNDNNNRITIKTTSLLTEILHELILTIGYFCLYSKDTKSILRLGQRPVILQKLINLPIQYFIHPQYYEVLFPTLIIACYNDPNNLRVLQDNFNTNYLSEFLESEQKSLLTSSSIPLENKEISSIKFKLINRFPKSEWNNAISYFSIKKTNIKYTP